MQRVTGARELLDGPLDARALAGNLRDLARANRLLGGAELSWRAVDHVRRTADMSAGALSLLDIGTGLADIPLTLVLRARRGGRPIRALAVDVREEIVALAARAAGGEPGIRVERISPDRLPYADGSFDVVHASLVVHHHEPGAARWLLAEMARVARVAVVVNDLHRARRHLAGAWLLARVATRNRYTRHDAPLSVRRAYTAEELGALAADVGLREIRRFRGPLGHRYAVVFEDGR